MDKTDLTGEVAIVTGASRRLVDAAVQGFGGLDIAINNAGVLGPIGPLRRIARPEEIAAAALFLVSPMASFVAGAALFADGGNSAVK